MKEHSLVLAVDDEADTRIFLIDLLDSEGYAVATVESGYEALQFIARRKPAIMIADYRMPGMDGMELLKKVRHASPETRIILLTAFGDCPMYLKALDLGADDLLLKPCKNEDLLRTLERVAEKIA